VLACLLAVLFEILCWRSSWRSTPPSLDPGTLMTSALATAGLLTAVYVLYLIQVRVWVTEVGAQTIRNGRTDAEGAGRKGSVAQGSAWPPTSRSLGSSARSECVETRPQRVSSRGSS
jgi:hypothetical protein